jgi:hypothetical protein
MSLYILTVESASDCKVLGAYLTEKAAKVASTDYVAAQDITFKRKLLKKDGEEVKKLMYVEDSKEADKKSIFMNTVAFEMPVSAGKKKAKKDPLAPKRGMSAFMLFSNEQRNKIKGENPEATFGEVGRKVGEAWKALNDKQKQVYVKKAEQDKKRYETELQKYTETQTTVA